MSDVNDSGDDDSNYSLFFDSKTTISEDTSSEKSFFFYDPRADFEWISSLTSPEADTYLEGIILHCLYYIFYIAGAVTGLIEAVYYLLYKSKDSFRSKQ